MSDYDSPWKEALERFLPAFLEFFFPEVHAALDWSRGYETLDKELQQIAPESEQGRRCADMLFKVWRHNGTDAWLLIHVEVQSQVDPGFPERMFVYYYRIFDRYRRRSVVSLAVLGDDNLHWRPSSYLIEELGCRNQFEFPMVKLLDYEPQVAMLESSANPFAAVVLAHLKTKQTHGEPTARLGWKISIIKGLFERGLSATEIRQLFRLIDWMMDLPREQDQLFFEEIHRYEEEKKMPYVTSVERLGLERGLAQGRAEGRTEGRAEGALEELRKTLLRLGGKRFGPPSEADVVALEATTDLERLERLSERLLEVNTWSELLATS